MHGEGFFRLQCGQLFGLQQCTPPCRQDGQQAPGSNNGACRSWLIAFVLWQLVASRLGYAVDAALYNRVSRAWRSLKAWLQQHELHHIRNSLNGPISSVDMSAGVDRYRGMPVAPGQAPAANGDLPTDYKMALSFHDGQPRTKPEEIAQSAWPFVGLFGGYSAYNHLACVKLMSLDDALTLTAGLRERHQTIFANSLFIAQCPFGHFPKAFVLNTVNGLVYVMDRKPGMATRLTPAVPPGPHGFIRWLEEFVNRLRDGTYVAGQLVPGEETSRGINIFPQQGPDLAVAVTNGIEALASAVYMAEHVQYWAYSIRLRVLPPGHPQHVPAQQRGFTEVQLQSRHWVLTDGNGQVREVRGRGVIGKHPVLCDEGFIDLPLSVEGGDPPLQSGYFVYQSCSGFMAGGHGTFTGDLLFVKRRLSDHEMEPQMTDDDDQDENNEESAGERVTVALGLVHFNVPQYIY